MRLRRTTLVLAGFCVPAVIAGSARAQSGTPDAPARGASDPLLTIVEFGDFQCPSCAVAAPVVDSLIGLHQDQIRLEYRHYPLPMHEHATRAAQAAVEAERQGAFWAYHDLLFRNGERLTDADLVGYADSLGLDAGSFAAALADGRHAGRVEADRLLGTSLAVTGTPTFFVNGYRVVGTPPSWVFELALEAFRDGRVESRPLEPPRPPEGDGRDDR